MAKSEMRAATERFRADFKAATAQYKSGSRNLELKARRTRMSLEDMDVARGFVLEAYQLLAEYYAACETIVRMLDGICRPLLTKNTVFEDVQSVVELIQEVNEATDGAEIAFDLVYDGKDLGDVGAIKPVASMEARMIQKTWESNFRSMPGYAQAQAKEKAQGEKAEKDAKRQIEDQENKNRELRKEAEVATTRCMKQVEQFRCDVNQALEEIRIRLLQEQEETREKLIDELRQMQQELDSLGFFAFGAKKALKQQIEDTTQRARYVISQQYIDDKFSAKKSAAEKAVKAYQEEVEAFCKTFISVRTASARIPSSQKLPPLRLCTPEEAEVVKYIQSYGGRQTWRELQNSVMSNYSSQKAGMMLRRLTNDLGFLVREEKGSDTIYRTVDTPAVVDYEVVQLNRGQMEKPCPAAPNIRNILRC